jgi:hypothetical protein
VGGGGGVGLRRGLERFWGFGSAGGWCRCGFCDCWSVLRGSVMAPHRGARLCVAVGCLARAGCERAREPPHPLAAGRAQARRGERHGRRRRRRQAAARGRFRVPASLGLRRMAQQAHDRPGVAACAGPLSGGAQKARSTCFEAKRPSTQCGHRLAELARSGYGLSWSSTPASPQERQSAQVRRAPRGLCSAPRRGEL